MAVPGQKTIETAMELARKAASFDQAQRYEEAIYFYTEAANSLLEQLQQNKISVNFRKTALGYIERAEFLKRELPRLLEIASKSVNQMKFEQAEFEMIKAQDLDANRHYALAIDGYKKATEIFLSVMEICTNEEMKRKIGSIVNEALERAEEIKKLEKILAFESLTNHLPEVPRNNLMPTSDPTKPCTSTSPTPPLTPSMPSKQQLKDEGLSKEEIAVLAATSNINGRIYVPFLAHDLKEKFHFQLPFADKDGRLGLAEKQKKKLKAWLRPSDIMDDPQIIKNIDCGAIKQTVISDCSFISSLSIAAAYEHRFGKQLVTSIIFPQNKKGEPVYNPDGKYMLKFHINGVWRKVVIDDYFPCGEGNELLCSYSQQKGEIWVSLLEKAYMKVMGGYDFPGSNSNIDLHVLTGWIPERIAIRKEADATFNSEQVFEKLLSRYHRGDCLITLATGKLSEAECDRAGLVDSHAYAVLDLRRVGDKKLLLVKNPWTHLRWKGRYSENDIASWTPELRKALNYDPSRAKDKDDGIFWIDLESVCHFFDVFYVNWNPALFPFTCGFHSCWHACSGPVKDLYSVADNPQYSLEVNNKTKSAVWILLTRHITEIDDFANNKEYITVMVYKNGKKVFLPFDPNPMIDGARINSPHYLCQMIIDEPGIQKYTLVVAQYEKLNTINYTLRVYSSTAFKLKPITSPYTVKKTETGKWEGISAAGCGNGADRDKYINNPLYHISLNESSDLNSLLITLKGPKQYCVGFEVKLVSSPRNKTFERQSSGNYRPGYTVIVLDEIPAGVYSIRPATFMSGQEGPFILSVESTCTFTMKRVPSGQNSS